MAIENEPVGAFPFCLQLWENIDQMHESSFFSYLFIEMTLVTSSI